MLAGSAATALVGGREGADRTGDLLADPCGEVQVVFLFLNGFDVVDVHCGTAEHLCHIRVVPFIGAG
jgi:hypothetical protein